MLTEVVKYFQTHHVRPWLLVIGFVLRYSTYKFPGSDVKPCVWAVVEVCLGILGACLPTYPALFRWKQVHNHRRPSRIFQSKSADSSRFPVLTPDERRSGFRSGVGNTQKEFLKMIDWADVPRAIEKGDGMGLQAGEIFDTAAQ